MGKPLAAEPHAPLSPFEPLPECHSPRYCSPPVRSIKSSIGVKLPRGGPLTARTVQPHPCPASPLGVNLVGDENPKPGTDLRPDDIAAVERLRDAFQILKNEMGKVIVGQQTCSRNC